MSSIWNFKKKLGHKKQQQKDAQIMAKIKSDPVDANMKRELLHIILFLWLFRFSEVVTELLGTALMLQLT